MKCCCTLRVHEGEVSLPPCETADRVLRLPASIDGMPVRARGDYALAAHSPDMSCEATETIVHDAQVIEHIVLPHGLRVIGSLRGCRDLQLHYLHMPSGRTMTLGLHSWRPNWGPVRSRSCLRLS